jgi:hypothetical protein
MGKMRFGHDPRNKHTGSSVEKFFQKDGTSEKSPKATDTADFEAIARKVMETHADTFKKLAESEKQDQVPATEKHFHTETVTTHDKLAREHSKLVRKDMETKLGELAEFMSHQNELFHILKRDISALTATNSILNKKMSDLEARKPEEKHTVTQHHTETIVKPTVPNLVWVGIGIALLTNAYILLSI